MEMRNYFRRKQQQKRIENQMLVSQKDHATLPSSGVEITGTATRRIKVPVSSSMDFEEVSSDILNDMLDRTTAGFPEIRIDKRKRSRNVNKTPPNFRYDSSVRKQEPEKKRHHIQKTRIDNGKRTQYRTEMIAADDPDQDLANHALVRKIHDPVQLEDHKTTRTILNPSLSKKTRQTRPHANAPDDGQGSLCYDSDVLSSDTARVLDDDFAHLRMKRRRTWRMSPVEAGTSRTLKDGHGRPSTNYVRRDQSGGFEVRSPHFILALKT